MPRLLVSVRSADEARKALAGGASILDVKEPANGPLGRASFETWREIRRVLPGGVALSVALGELPEWIDERRPDVPDDAFEDVTFCKVGLAHAKPGWESAWRDLRASLPTRGCRWIAVAYTDWRAAGSPHPSEILDGMPPECAGVLFDTWDKSSPAAWPPELVAIAGRVIEKGLMLAVAGSVTAATVDRLAALRPHVIAVRGAACEQGDRMRDLERHRVEEMAEIVRKLPDDRLP